MFIHLYRSDLVAGYDRLRETQSALPSTYRQELLQAYSRRMQAYNRRLQRARSWKKLINPALLLFSLILVILCGVGFWFSITGSPTGLVLFCVAGMLVVAFALLGLILGSKPSRPENPLGNDPQSGPTQLRQQLFPDLTPRWLDGLAAPVPTDPQVVRWAKESGKHGLIGEFKLVRALAAALPPEYFILHGLMQNYGDDMDVLVVGPCGIWLFEAKYLNAQISYQDSLWRFRKTDPKTGQVVDLDLGEAPDQQWVRMRDEIRRTLAYRGRNLVRQLPALGEIQGGIVFTHPQASYQIEKSPPFAWGLIPGWVQMVLNAPPVPGMDLRVQLQLLDLLLLRHQEVNPGRQVVSMAAQADRVIGEAKSRIETWARGR